MRDAGPDADPAATIHRPGAGYFDPRLIRANAYTIGPDIVLADDVDPTTDRGRTTLAHELAHVACAPHDGVVRRQASQLDEQSIGPDYAHALDAEQLEADIRYLLGRRRSMAVGTVEHEVATTNLAALTDEVGRRGSDSPALRADEVAGQLEATITMCQTMVVGYATLAANKYGLRQHDVTEELLSDSVDLLGTVVELAGSARKLLEEAAEADPEVASALVTLAQDRQLAAARGTELLRRHVALLALTDMAAEHIRLDLEYTVRTLDTANRQIRVALAGLVAAPASVDALAAATKAIEAADETLAEYSGKVKGLSPAYGFELDIKALEADLAAPPVRTDPAGPADPTRSVIPEPGPIQISLTESGTLAGALGEQLRAIATNEVGIADHPATARAVERAVDQLTRAMHLVGVAAETLTQARAADGIEATGLLQAAAVQARIARAALDAVRAAIRLLRLADSARTYGTRADLEYMFVTLHRYGDTVDGALARLEAPSADGTEAAATIAELETEFGSFKQELKEIDEATKKAEMAVAVILAIFDLLSLGYGLYKMSRPPARPAGLPIDDIPAPARLPAAPRYLHSPPAADPDPTPPVRPLFAPRVPWQATRPKGTLQSYDVFPRTDIDWNRVRTRGDQRGIGLTNRDAAARFGLGPQLDDDGNTATLHHLGHDSRGPLVEASTKYHGVQSPNQDTLHSQYGRSKPHPTHQPDRKKFDVDDREYWKWRGTNAPR